MITEKAINKIVSKLKIGTKIRVHRDYTSFVVGFMNDEKTELIVYKDWNKYKRRWDYHINQTSVIAYMVILYKEEYKGWFAQGKKKDEC